MWLVAEDLSPLIAPFGDSTVRTPNIERLAEEGIRYVNMYSVSGVCAPSRAGIATGMYPSSIGAHHMRVQWSTAYFEFLGIRAYEAVPPPRVKMMSEILRADGYYCTNNDKTDYQFAPPHTAWDENGIQAHWRGRAADQPFFSIFNFAITHESQVFGPSSKKNLRYQGDFPDLSNYDSKGLIDFSAWEMLVPENVDVPVPPYLANTPGTRNDVRRVYSNILQMDKQVGFILDQLEADGLLDNTIIFWYTDHGGPLPRQKRLLYDSGLRLPMIVKYRDNRRAGEIDNQLVSFIDLAPTTFSLAGIEPPTYLQGQSFLGPYTAPAPRKFIHAAADRLDTEYDMIRAVKDRRYKYLKNFMPERGYYLKVAYRERMVAMQELLRLRDEGKLDEYQAQWFRNTKPGEELFDTWNDPHELNNLAGDPAYAAKLKELQNECVRWMDDIQDKGHLTETQLIESMWGSMEQPQTGAPVINNDDNGLTSISCSTLGGSIGYKTSITDRAWSIYKEPLASEIDTLIVKTHRIGYLPSEEVLYMNE